MDAAEMVETGGIRKVNMREPMEKLEWDSKLVVLHEELNSLRTCVPGDIDPKMLCNDTMVCIMCSAIHCTSDLQKGRGMEEAMSIVKMARDNNTYIDKMNGKELVGYWADFMESKPNIRRPLGHLGA
eukprot:6776642-Heterocapsa_arctica.AAC.1